LLIETVGPGYCHFPHDRPESWFEQLTSENLVVEKVAGQVVRKWKPIRGRANEALDCRVYAYAALNGLYITRRLKLEYQAEILAQQTGKQPAQAVKTRSKVRRGSWMEG
jgi:phage terminase large subunit GpA-like protein